MSEPTGGVPGPAARRPPLRSLTGARFLAALGVVAFHVDLEFGGTVSQTAADRLLDPAGPANALLDFIAGAGSLGVNFFFILSGFVLAYNYLGEPGRMATSRRDFFLARFARIYPVYLLALLLAVAFRISIGSPCRTELCAAGDTPWMAMASLLLVQAWFPLVGDAYNGPGWTLSVEAFFYACFPFVVVAVSRLRTPRSLGLLVVLAFLATQIGPTVRMALDAGPSVPSSGVTLLLQFAPLLRLPEFVLGVAAWCWIVRFGLPRGISGWRVDALLLGTLPLLWVGGKVVGRLGLHPMTVNNGLFDPLLLLVVLAMSAGTGLVNRVLSLPVFQALGESSYALYVLHWPCWYWFASVIPVGLRTSAPILLGYAVGMVVLSVLVWRFVERPARRSLLRLRSRPRATVPRLLGAGDS